MVVEANASGMGAVGFLWAMIILFKIMAIVDWSWFIVICWPVALWLLIMAIVLIVGGVAMWLVADSRLL